MLKVATVPCTPPARSRIFTGWRIALMPTRSIARRRVSGLAWTSGIGSLASRWFIGSFPGSREIPILPNHGSRPATMRRFTTR
jgi:hypothetical protein